MPCHSCDPLLMQGTATAHGALAPVGKPRKLRPVHRRPIIVTRYRCHECGINWLHETDLNEPGEGSWLCLGEATSILEPIRLPDTPTSRPATTGQPRGH